LRLEVGALLLEHRLVALEQRQEALELRPVVAARLVHVDQLANLGKRQAQALAAQRELEARAVALRVDPALSGAARREQPLVLVEADRARGDVELARQLSDREFGALGGGRARHGMRIASLLRCSDIIDCFGQPAGILAHWCNAPYGFTRISPRAAS
jgi:hypothetical protein